MAVIVERVVECRSDIERLWPVLADTSYLNRMSGLAPLALTPIEDGSSARFRVKTKAGGFAVEWDEEPFQWREHQHFHVRRHFRAGPIDAVESRFEFMTERDHGGGTRVTIRLTLTPKIRLLAPIVRFGAKKQLEQLCAAVIAADRAVSQSEPLPSTKAAVSEDALGRARAALITSGVAPSLAERLCRHVRDERDEKLTRIRPFELADEWGCDRKEVLAACLRGVAAGLVELRWELICPSCRGAAETVPTLQALSDHGECHMCDISLGIDRDQAVEATFAPSKNVRRVDVAPYCVGGPGRLPHVVEQSVLPARGSIELRAPDKPGRHRLFIRGGSARAVDVTPSAPASIALDDNGAEPVSIGPGGTIRVTSSSDVDRHVKLERTQIADQAATAREVTAMPGFRRDFSSEVLRSDLTMKVSRVALLFSDLTASTQLYSTVGDAPALRLVHDHFDVVIGAIEKHGGTLVKTIGDAVMAVFSDDLAAVRASLAILDAFDAFRAGNELAQRTHIKLGLFAGASYLVTANNVLDYFGQTVNIAARVQAQAESGQLVVDAALADAAVARGILDGKSIVERFTARLKGVDTPVALARVASNAALAATA